MCKQLIVGRCSLATLRLFSSRKTVKMSLLSSEDREKLITPLTENGWKLSGQADSISKRFTFKNFAVAWRFMNRVAEHAEKHNHHPDWCNCYNRVDVTYSTHDAGGLTRRDANLAQLTDEAAAAEQKDTK